MTSQLSRPVSRPASRALGTALILTVQLMLILDMTVVNVALPDIRTGLGFSPSALSWVLNAYTLTFGGLLLLGGRLGDVFGRRRTFMMGLAIFTLGSLAGGLAPSAGILVGARALQGVGAAIAAPSVLALLSTSAPDAAARTKVLALFSAVSSAGGSIGLILGGVLTGYASWRWSLFINVPLGLLVLALVPRHVAETERQHGRFDVLGAVTATLGSAALVFGFIHAPDHGWTSVGTLSAFAISLVLLTTLFVHERRTPAPLLPAEVLRSRTRLGAIAVMALFIAAQFSLFFFLVQFMQAVLGFGALKSGFAFLPLTVLIFATSRVTPRLVQRFGTRPLLLTGTLLVGAANLWLVGIGQDSTYLGRLILPLMLVGVGAGLTFMPVTVTVLDGVEPVHAGSASGMLQMSQQVGGSLGLAVLVTVYASHTSPGHVVAGMPQTFAVGAGLLAAAFLVALTVLKPARRRPDDQSTSELEQSVELAA
jgi:EmrB/QacA subfamily drug resistance transporter